MTEHRQKRKSKLTWQSWTIVTTTVDASTAPMEAIMPNSMSAKPSPFPIRKPAEKPLKKGRFRIVR